MLSLARLKDRGKVDLSNVIVAGAGIVGVASAIWLQRAGHRVILVDRAGAASGTSYGNAGILATGALVPVTTPGLVRKAPGMLLDRDAPLFLCWSYLPRLLPFLRRYLAHATENHVLHYARAMSCLLGDSLIQHQSLAAGTPAARFVRDDDYCFGYASREDFEADAGAWDLRRRHHVVFKVMQGAAYARLDPLFADRFHTVVCCENHGRISDPGAYIRALAAHFTDQGGLYLQTLISDIEMTDGACTALFTANGRLSADHIVLALGPWSARIARKMGLRRLSFESERGYHVDLMAPSEMPRAPMMVTAGKFVVTPMEGRIRCAGVIEFGGLEAPPRRAPLAMIKRQIGRLLPDLAYSEMREWMGHRPAPSDSLPIIGPVDPGGRSYLAFGHQHVGLTGGAKTGRIIADMISGQRSGMDMTPFDPKRYAASGA